jgi:phage-related protein
MARTSSEGEKPLAWVGSAKRDFLAFPDEVKDEMGHALGMAQFGGKHPSAKPWAFSRSWRAATEMLIEQSTL